MQQIQENWWLYADARDLDMRAAIKRLNQIYCYSMGFKTSEYLSGLNTNVLPVNSANCYLLEMMIISLVFYIQKFMKFGHEQQEHQLREAESGSRYTPTTTFETFPFPWAPGAEPVDDPRVQAIAQAAKELVEQRDRWLNPQVTVTSEVTVTSDAKKKRTLTNLYNARPTWLELAHKKLDEAVFAAYGWPSDLSDEEILERLLALNLERANAR